MYNGSNAPNRSDLAEKIWKILFLSFFLNFIVNHLDVCLSKRNNCIRVHVSEGIKTQKDARAVGELRELRERRRNWVAC